MADQGDKPRAATEPAGVRSIDQFTGPLFIVGMPRSGTKLLRDLLNQHPSIGLPVGESHFVVPMVRRFGERPDFEDAAERRRFYDALRSTGFFAYMHAQGLVFEPAQLEQVAARTSWCSVLETIFRHYGQTPEGGVWGDTTPQQLLHIELLKTLCPGARFIHIIRDPRDRCLSVRKKFGTSILRTAERWRRNVGRARQAGVSLGDGYCEVSYEALVSQPRETLEPLARHLGLSFTEAMLRPGRVTEQSGEARGRTEILIGNSGKYLTQLRPKEIRRIEEITFPLLGPLGYVPRHASTFRPLGAAAMFGLTATDALMMLSIHVRKDGLFRGLRRWRGQGLRWWRNELRAGSGHG